MKVPGKVPGLEIDLDGVVPVYRQIAEGIRAALQDGRLQAGWKLPPTRDLARDLGVNRNTVVAAYETLAGEGLVESHTGRGTFLSSVASPRKRGDDAGGASGSSGDGTPWFTAFSRAVEGPGVGRLQSIYRVAIASEGISFAGSYPADELMPVDEVRRALGAVMRERGAELLRYGPTAGYPPLREAIAAGMRDKGSPANPDGVLITNGAQQALELVFRTLLDRGDPVVLEEPTYTGALSVLNSLGARLVGVPVDEQGIRPDLLALALERHRPKLVYVQPTFQNPTTGVLGMARRREVLALAARHRCVVVEDDWGGELRFEGDPPPTLHALDGGCRVIHLGTFSKKLLPGLRIGWVAAPAPVMDRLVALKQIEDCGTSPLIQAGLHRFLENGGLSDHLRRVLPAYRRRCDEMMRSMERHFPPGVRWTRPGGGLFVWVTLTRGADSNELFEAARRRGVLFSRGELFYSNGAGREKLRLTFAAVSPEQIDSGISILGELMKARREGVLDPAERAAESVPIL